MERDHIGVGVDHLSVKEIARAWSKVLREHPELLMAAVVSAFWRGEFESGAQSECEFIWWYYPIIVDEVVE